MFCKCRVITRVSNQNLSRQDIWFITQINFNHNMDMWMKLHNPRCSSWSSGMRELFHPTHYHGFNYVSKRGLKLIGVKKKAQWSHRQKQNIMTKSDVTKDMASAIGYRFWLNVLYHNSVPNCKSVIFNSYSHTAICSPVSLRSYIKMSHSQNASSPSTKAFMAFRNKRSKIWNRLS